MVASVILSSWASNFSTPLSRFSAVALLTVLDAPPDDGGYGYPSMVTGGGTSSRRSGLRSGSSCSFFLSLLSILASLAYSRYLVLFALFTLFGASSPAIFAIKLLVLFTKTCGLLLLKFFFLVLSVLGTGFPLLHSSRKGFVVQITGGVFRLGKTRCKHGPCIEGN